jgi:hypothetical protein
MSHKLERCVFAFLSNAVIIFFPLLTYGQGAKGDSAAEEEIVVKTRVMLNGRVNGQNLALSGRGIIQPYDGTTDGRYIIEALPSGMDPRILSAFTVTGYSNSSQNYRGAVNPFRDTSYTYERTVTFQDGKKLEFKAACSVEGDRSIVSRFELNGEVDVPELVEMEPLVESWTQTEPGEIYGHFTPVWTTKEGKKIVGEAMTKYHLPKENTIPRREHRYITILTNVADKKFVTKHQMVTLFADLPFHSVGEKNTIDFSTLSEIEQQVQKQVEKMREERRRLKNFAR